MAASTARGAQALDRLRSGPNHRLEIRSDAGKGRGIFAREPVIIVPTEQCALLDRTILHDYYFHWDGDPEGPGRGAVALGLVALCNHSRRPNARVRRNPARETLDLMALATIVEGDEVTIDYNCPLWFQPQD